MGIPPSELLAMSFYDYQAAAFHWQQGQDGDEESDPLSAADFDEMLVSLHSQARH